MPPLVQSAIRFFQSSIGKKFVVAATGIGLMLFLIAHLLGNLLIHQGPDAINAYARKLRELGPLLWVARIGLIVAVVLHIVFTVQLNRENRSARSRQYAIRQTRQASRASLTMIWTGLTILAFVIYHLMHYTFGIGNIYRDPAALRYHLPDGSHNVYNMMVDGFRVWYVSAFYIVALFLLCTHLSHGFSSVFQTLGITTPRTRGLIAAAGHIFAWGLFAGYISIPLSVLAGIHS